MRTAITLGYPHGGGTPVLVSGTEVPIRRQRDELKAIIRRGKFHPRFHAIEIWESDSGCVKYLRRLPKEAKGKPAAPPEPPEVKAPEKPDAPPEVVPADKPKAQKPKVKTT